MLIQLMEANSQGNVRSLGLLPANYVPDGDQALRRWSWAGGALLVGAAQSARRFPTLATVFLQIVGTCLKNSSQNTICPASASRLWRRMKPEVSHTGMQSSVVGALHT